MNGIQNYINGKFVSSKNDECIDNFNPATNEKIATIPRSSSQDIQNAVDACNLSKSSWSKLSITERAEWLDIFAVELDKSVVVISNLSTERKHD